MLVQDLELGLLNNEHLSSQAWTTPPNFETHHEDISTSPSDDVEPGRQEDQNVQPNQIHQVIGEALEVFSRHLRGHSSHPPDPSIEHTRG